jgi:hypothetical protein
MILPLMGPLIGNKHICLFVCLFLYKFIRDALEIRNMCVQLYYYILHVTFKCCFIYYHVICNGEH